MSDRPPEPPVRPDRWLDVLRRPVHPRLRLRRSTGILVVALVGLGILYLSIKPDTDHAGGSHYECVGTRCVAVPSGHGSGLSSPFSFLAPTAATTTTVTPSTTTPPSRRGHPPKPLTTLVPAVTTTTAPRGTVPPSSSTTARSVPATASTTTSTSTTSTTVGP